MKAPTPAKQLAAFLAKFTPEIAGRARKAVGVVRKRLPGACVLVYDNYNALAIGFGATERTSEAVLSIAVWPRWVSLFFMQAKGLADPQQVLKGSGKQARHLVLDSAASLDLPAVRHLIARAVAASKTPMPLRGGRIIIKSISARQRPRRPA